MTPTTQIERAALLAWALAGLTAALVVIVR